MKRGTCKWSHYNILNYVCTFTAVMLILDYCFVIYLLFVYYILLKIYVHKSLTYIAHKIRYTKCIGLQQYHYRQYIKIAGLLDRRSHLRFACSHGLVQISCNSLRPSHVYIQILINGNSYSIIDN